MKDKEFVRDLAENYANVCLIDRNVVASVHLEDKSGEPFSEACLLPDAHLEGYDEIDQVYDDLSKILL